MKQQTIAVALSLLVMLEHTAPAFAADVTVSLSTPSTKAPDTTGKSRRMLPRLVDLGPGQTYHGQEGGRYPNGSNVRPAAHDAAGRKMAQNRLQPAFGEEVAFRSRQQNSSSDVKRILHAYRFACGESIEPR